MRTRSRTALGLILAVGVVVAGAVPAGGQAAPAPTGTATATLTLPQVGDLALGELGTDVSTRGSRRAGASADLAGLVTVTADQDDPGPAGDSVTLPGGLGSLAVSGVTAGDDGTEVSARIASLTADLAADPVDLRVGAGTGLEAVVDATSASARDVAEVETVTVRLADVLGEDVLGGLGLDALLDLAVGLGPALDLEEGAPADLTVLLELRDGLEGGLSLDALDGLLDAVADVDLDLFRDDLAGGIGAAELLAVEGLRATVTADATASSSAADAVCAVGAVRLLGGTVLDDGTCEDLAGVLDDADLRLTALLGVLPGAEGDLATVDGGDVFATADGARRSGNWIGEARVVGPSVAIGGLTLAAPGEGGLADLLDDLLGDGLGDLLDDLGLLPDGSGLAGVVVEPITLSTVALDAAVTFSRPTTTVIAGGECEEPPAEGADRVGRIQAANRIATAAAVAECAFDTADVALLARSDVHADALTGSSLISLEPAPLLLTPPTTLAPEVRAELERLGVSRVVLLGGQAALSAGVEAELRAMGLEVQRIGGENRFDTAALIAAELGAGAPDAYVVEGLGADPRRGWPDAVSVAPLAAHTGRPVLLVTTDEVPSWTAEALDDLGVERATIVGGTAAVGAGVAQWLEDAGHDTTRLAGADRFGTSAAVHAEKVAFGMDRTMLYLVSGHDWPDALVTGAAAASLGHTMHLVHHEDLDASPATRQTLLDHADAFQAVRIIGGPGTIAAEVEADVRAVLATGT